MGSGFRTFASGEVLTADNVQNYLMDQAVMVFAGTAERGSALASPEVGMTAYSTATGLQVYNGSAWVDVSTGYGVASGANSTATATISGTAYTILTFTSSGTLTVSKAGLFDCLVVGAGASGGIRSADRAAGGGGGGQVLQQTIYLNANATVTIGAKGVGVTVNQTNGNRGTYSAVAQLSSGGGGGGKAQGGVDNAAGSGGGGVGTTTAEGGALAGSLVGANNGGNGGAGTTAGGGGGGSTQVGQANVSTTGGAGGTGTDVSTFIGGSALYHGAGGGGASIGGTGGTAGNSTGGNGGSSGAGSSATATNYGCGGGGGVTTTSGAGADGVVYVRFRT